MLVRPESNSRPPAEQPNAQPTEPPVRGARRLISFRNGIEFFTCCDWEENEVGNWQFVGMKSIVSKEPLLPEVKHDNMVSNKFRRSNFHPRSPRSELFLYNAAKKIFVLT